MSQRSNLILFDASCANSGHTRHQPWACTSWPGPAASEPQSATFVTDLLSTEVIVETHPLTTQFDQPTSFLNRDHESGTEKISHEESFGSFAQNPYHKPVIKLVVSQPAVFDDSKRLQTRGAHGQSCSVYPSMLA